MNGSMLLSWLSTIGSFSCPWFMFIGGYWHCGILDCWYFGGHASISISSSGYACRLSINLFTSCSGTSWRTTDFRVSGNCDGTTVMLRREPNSSCSNIGWDISNFCKSASVGFIWFSFSFLIYDTCVFGTLVVYCCCCYCAYAGCIWPPFPCWFRTCMTWL